MVLQLLLTIKVGKTDQSGRHNWILLNYSADHISKSIFIYLPLGPRKKHLNYGPWICGVMITQELIRKVDFQLTLSLLTQHHCGWAPGIYILTSSPGDSYEH